MDDLEKLIELNYKLTQIISRLESEQNMLSRSVDGDIKVLYDKILREDLDVAYKLRNQLRKAMAELGL